MQVVNTSWNNLEFNYPIKDPTLSKKQFVKAVKANHSSNRSWQTATLSEPDLAWGFFLLKGRLCFFSPYYCQMLSLRGLLDHGVSSYNIMVSLPYSIGWLCRWNENCCKYFKKRDKTVLHNYFHCKPICREQLVQLTLTLLKKEKLRRMFCNLKN